MRFVITQNMSVDGKIEFLGDWFNPAEQDAELLEFQQEQARHEKVLVLGRQTFEDFRSFWPDTSAGGDEANSQHLNSVSKKVFSRTMTNPGWVNSEVVRDDPVAYVRALKETGGDEDVIGLTGSISLTHLLLVAGVVDELRLLVYPSAQGAGRGLLPDSLSDTRFSLGESRRFSSGVAYSSYVSV